MKPDKLRRHYKNKASGYDQWEQKTHAEEYLLYPENITEHISIDEVSLSKGELYTFVTNKSSNGRKGTMIASIKGTKSKTIQDILNKIPLEKRKQVKEVSLDMAPNMAQAARESFPESKLVVDRFHVVRLVNEALQHLRVKKRWEVLDKENEAIKNAKAMGKKYKPKELKNGDTLRQLLARSRYTLAKKQNDWTGNQVLRAELLFEHYPEMKTAYHLTLEFRNIYEQTLRDVAATKLKAWMTKVLEFDKGVFRTVVNSIEIHFENILNFFNNRSTNAHAESFNARIKLFRANQRGVVDTQFFLFRLSHLFA